MRGRPLVVGVLLLAGLAGCAEQSVPPPPPAPSVNPAPSGLTTEPQALMATIGGVIERAGVGDDIQQGEIESGATAYQPCGLLVSDASRAAGSGLQLDAVWAAGLEVDPVSSFQNAGPSTVLDVRVVYLPDDAAAAAAAARVRAARCPSGEFPLNIGLATARWGARTVTVGSTQARLTTATVERVNPEIEAGVYLPGDARLIFAHGPLLVSIEALAMRSRKANAAAEITAAAQEEAMTVAAAIVKALPTSSGE
jgi:hypothetical protein